MRVLNRSISTVLRWTPQPLRWPMPPGETLRMGDAMELMLEGLHKVMHGEPRQGKELRKQADDVNVLYTAIKLYGAHSSGRTGGGGVKALGGNYRNVAQP